MNRPSTFIIAFAAVLACVTGSGIAQDGSRAPSWPEVKCARYTRDWAQALARRGTQGLGREFLDRHQAFLASGCTTQGDVCPRSPAELDLANLMTIRAMNEGTASTFLPFGCHQQSRGASG